MAGSDVTPIQPGEVDSIRRELEAIRQWQREMMPSVAQSVTGIVTEITARFPIASVIPYAGSAAPTGWLLADGSAVSRATYSDLFDVIGTQYGVGDGSTTFNVPNLKGRVPVGVDGSQGEFDVRGETGGEKTHTLSTGEMPSHTHTFTGTAHRHSVLGLEYTTNTIGLASPYSSAVGGGYNNSEYTTAGGTNSSEGGGGAHNNLQPYIALPYIIKHYKF